MGEVTQPPGPPPEPPYGTPPQEPPYPPHQPLPPQDQLPQHPPQYPSPYPQQDQPPQYPVPPQGQPPYGAGEPPSGRKKLAGRIGTAGAAGAAVAGKAGLLGKLFLAFKGLAFLAKAKAFLSLFASVAVYAIFWGWRFAVGFVLLMFLHELGHVVAFKAQGLKVSAPMFIPLLGAYTKAEGELSTENHAWAALAGPIAGALGAMTVLQLSDLNGSLLLQALAYTAFLLNLINLVPFPPLDGGAVAGALHPAVWWAGIAAMVGLLLWRPSPVWFLVAVLGGIALWRRVRDRRNGTLDEYRTVPPQTRLLIAGCYVGLAVLCLYGMHVSYVPKPV